MSLCVYQSIYLCQCGTLRPKIPQKIKWWREGIDVWWKEGIHARLPQLTHTQGC